MPDIDIVGIEVSQGRVLEEWIDINDHMNVAYYVLAFDAKRIHQFMRMYHAEHGHIAATAEWMNLHVDLTRRRVAPWPESILASIRQFAEQQGHRPYPIEAGRQMRIARPLFNTSERSDE